MGADIHPVALVHQSAQPAGGDGAVVEQVERKGAARRGGEQAGLQQLHAGIDIGRRRLRAAANQTAVGVEIEIARPAMAGRSEEHTSELQSLMRISYAVFCLKKKKQTSQ